MKIECPRCSQKMEIKIEMNDHDCRYCRLTDSERNLLDCFIIVRGNITELIEETGNSRELIMRELCEIENKVLAGITRSSFVIKIQRMDNSVIESAISIIGKEEFETFPDMVQVLETHHPAIVKRFQAESPRNWRARIGRRLGEYARRTGKIEKAGRNRNTQVWRVVAENNREEKNDE